MHLTFGWGSLCLLLCDGGIQNSGILVMDALSVQCANGPIRFTSDNQVSGPDASTYDGFLGPAPQYILGQ